MTRASRLLIGSLAVAATACSVPALDLEGKSCPCVSGYTCDQATNTCTRGGGDVIDAPVVDGATGHGLDMTKLSKVSTSLPLLDGPAASSMDCGTFTISFPPESNLQADELVTTAFVDPNTKTFWLLYPCKNVDNGWNIALASWDRVAPQVTIAPPKATGGINPIIGVDDVRNDGQTIGSARQMHVAFGADHRIYGTVLANNPSAGISQMLPVIAASPTAISIASVHTDDPTVLQGDGTGWYAKSGSGTDILFYSGTFYLYSLHWDGTTMTADGNPLTSIGLATSTDMLSSQFRTTPLVTGWSDPMVSYDSGMFHMVARRLDDNFLYYVRGTAPDQFDFAHPQLIDLTNLAGAAGAWDTMRWPNHPGSDEPEVTSAQVIDGTMYLFYAAGSPTDGGGVYPQEKRGVGVFTVPVLP